MKRAMRKVAGAIALFASFGVAGATAFAQVPTGNGGTGGTGSSGGNTISLIDPLGGKSFLTVVNNVGGFLFTDVAIPLTVIMVLVGAFQMMSSAGDPEKFTKGRRTLIYAAIGLAVAIIAGGVTTIIQSILGGS